MYVFILANILRTEQNISSGLIQPSRLLLLLLLLSRFSPV